MPIRIPADLPALDVLTNENIFVMDEKRATMQDIRPLQVGILNLMPNKIETEVQLLRLLSNSPLQINIDLIRIDRQAPKNTPKAHMDNFYYHFDDIEHKNYDGLVVTGAPLAKLDYENVKYWSKMKSIMDWTKTHVQSTLFLCWATHAAMYHFFGVNRTLRDEKLSGVFQHNVHYANDELVRGFDPTFFAPHSRFGEISACEYEAINGLRVIASSKEAGAYVVGSKDKRMVFVTGHPEYDPDTLSQEFLRDAKTNSEPQIPKHYFVNDEPKNIPHSRWRAHGTLLFTNWLNYYVYQTTPYDLSTLKADN